MSQFKKEYLEQSDALRRTLDNFLSKDFEINSSVMQDIFSKDFTNILFTGMGSSFYAGYYITNYLNSRNKPSYVVEASELAYFGVDQIREDTLIVIISKGGENEEVIQALNRIKNKHYVLAITDDKKSTLSLNSNSSIYTYAGEEKAPTTKSFLCTLGLLMLFGYWITDRKIDQNKYQALFEGLLINLSLASCYLLIFSIVI